MKYIKYISFLFVFFLIGMVGVKADDAELVCKYTIKASDLIKKFGDLVIVDKDSVENIYVYLTPDKKYHFKVNATDYIVNDKGEIESFPRFGGFDDSSGTYSHTYLDVQYLVNYFYYNKINSSNCPELKIYAPTEYDRAVYAFAGYDINDSNVIKIQPDKIPTTEEYKKSGGFRCYYECIGNDSREISVIHYYNNLFSIEETESRLFKNGKDAIDFSDSLKTENDCPNEIYKNKKFDKNGQLEFLYFSTTRLEIISYSNKCVKVSEKDYLKTPNHMSPDYESQKSPSDMETDMDLSGCIIDPGLREMIDWIMNLVSFIAIILLIVLGMLDFIKAAATGDQDSMKKSKDHFLKRLIACVLLFLSPLIVSIVLSLINISAGEEGCNASNKNKSCPLLNNTECKGRTDCTWTNNTCKSACNILSVGDCSKRSDCILGQSSGSSMPVCKQIIEDVVDCTKLDSSSCKQHSYCKFSNNTCKTACDYLSISECNNRNDCKWGISAGSSTGTCKAK